MPGEETEETEEDLELLKKEILAAKLDLQRLQSRQAKAKQHANRVSGAAAKLRRTLTSTLSPSEKILAEIDRKVFHNEPFSTILVVFLYLLLGVLVYSWGERSEGWTVVDCVYFCMVTMSTVGYGDLSPTTAGMRVFTLLMILAGIVLVFSRVVGVSGRYTSPVTSIGRRWLGRMFPPIHVDLDGDGESDYVILQHPVIYYSKNMLPTFALTLAVQLASAGVFLLVEPAWTYFDAFYLCIVTATTVGYGDVSITTQSAKIWASCHIMLSVAMMGELLTTFDLLREERRRHQERVMHLEKRLDADLLRSLLARAEELRPDKRRRDDGLGLGNLEFALAMLLQLEVVELGQLQPFIKKFREFDVDCSGRLDERDLEIMLGAGRGTGKERLKEAVRRASAGRGGQRVGPREPDGAAAPLLG